MKMEWSGVIPAITTPFKEDFSIDHDFLARHCRWLIDNGCAGVVALGSLGEGATLTFEEKAAVLRTCVKAIGGRAYVVSGVSSLSTAEAVAIAKMAEAEGCNGLMVLPQYVYLGDWRETKAHVSSILSATRLSAMLYNNPIAYKVDFIPDEVRELLEEHPTLHAIKESSADVRRVSALRALVGDERLRILCGVDDLIVEAVYAGAVGWIAGLVNAFPAESVELFELARRGHSREAFELYRWFLPLLRMDTVPKFVQLIKLAQEMAGLGNERVRPPRLMLIGAELQEARATIAQALDTRPGKFARAGVPQVQ
jgi:dihydrodipicolinate synthase/N-acetylneuraminate lyase